VTGLGACLHDEFSYVTSASNDQDLAFVSHWCEIVSERNQESFSKEKRATLFWRWEPVRAQFMDKTEG
jgi:c-di-GMP-binding flagellar brake protein YcgR